MNLEQLKLLEEGHTLPFSITSKYERWGELVVNGKIAIPIEKHASYFKTTKDISILDGTGREIGLLCFTREKGQVTWNQLTENQFIAFLSEVNYSQEDKVYQFLHNYLVIHEFFYEEYIKKYKRNAPLWGGFYHTTSGIKTNNYQVDIEEIKIKDLNHQPQIFLENAVRAIAQPYAFERFLKFYHLLELRFDFEVIDQIKALDIETEPEKIGEILSEYADNEIVRLEDIISKYCLDIPALTEKLNLSAPFRDQSHDLFFRFGSSKKGNPFNGQENKLKALITLGFEEKNLTSCNVSYQNNYDKFITRLTAFWIYRIRCSVAHNKIGEYILSMDKENYLVEFIEPLLMEVLKQCFKK